MSKAVLVIDMQERCLDCPLGYEDDYGDWCIASVGETGEHRDIYEIVHNKLPRPDWCPLKPLPDKKPNLKAFPSSLNDASWNAGYNNCINDILEGINEQ